MSSENPVSQQVNDKQKDQGKQQEKRPRTYRVQESRVFEINRKHRDRRQRALLIKQVSFGLFGSKRYRNIILECSLNNFYDTLNMANILQRRVEGLAMVINFAKVKYELFEEGNDKGEDKEYSKFIIKLTKSPTEQDKKDPGYNAPFNKQDLSEEITQVINWKRRTGGNQRRKGGAQRGNNRRRENNEPRDNKRYQGRNQSRNYQGKNQRQNNNGYERRDRQNYKRQQRRVDERDRRSNQNMKDQRQPRKQNRKDERYKNERSSYDRYKEKGYKDQNYHKKSQQRSRNQSNPRNRDRKEEQGQFRRGAPKSRGNSRGNQGGDREYKQQHLNREVEDRGDRRPGRRARYEDQDN